MFPTFTGNARRRPQVNLSGRQNQNPFAQASGSPTGPSKGSHVGPSIGRGAALANAQQGRLARQQERQKNKAAVVLQKTWRGHAARKQVRRKLRASWDSAEGRRDLQDVQMKDDDATTGNDESSDDRPYLSDDEALSQMSMLGKFIDLRDRTDLARLPRFHSRWTKTLQAGGQQVYGQQWQMASYRLIDVCIGSLSDLDPDTTQKILVPILKSLSQQCRKQLALSSRRYYSRLRQQLLRTHTNYPELIVMPLQDSSTAVSSAYCGFALEMLAHSLEPDIGEPVVLALASQINCKLLGRSLDEELARLQSSGSSQPFDLSDRRSRICLLAQFIYIYRHAHNFERPARYASEQAFVHVVGALLSSLVEEIEVEASFAEMEHEPASFSKMRQQKAVSDFERDQIMSLVDQESIRGLLGMVDNILSSTSQASGHDSRILATYVLTLLRLFPSRGNDIRMWLYLGLGSDQACETRPPVIRYFWQAASSTDLFTKIGDNSRSAIELLTPRRSKATKAALAIDDQWRLMLLFFELYKFVLMMMDDDEFFRDGRDTQTSRTLTLADIQRFTIFLKNLGFTMYYNLTDIVGGLSEAEATEDLSKLFRYRNDAIADTTDCNAPPRDGSASIAGVRGVSLDYVKGLVTELLRQLYARDSRRPFLPKNHWLMTSRFDMTHFIDGVVQEEERRRHIDEQETEPEEDALSNDPTLNLIADRHRPTVGTRNLNGLLRSEAAQRAQRRASRKRYLQAVAPRQQILQNMPFFIPFTTRVQIFRRFIHLDQYKRRNGIVDGEAWQLQMGMERHHNLQRHSARIRREHEFEDAYEQFFELGAGLKEPIQIQFVDQFDAVEAGIDGGGVTKEFLTSVTAQAFADTEGVRMFAENDQHLLFPNPSAMDEQRELLRESGFKHDSAEFRQYMMQLLNRYEFLGRIIGKCLYEGILIDVGFAGFFLLKWALTGGTGSAPRETGYRASINDLRDFDEGLYQGLLQLKNHPGNVEDFSLNFTVTDTLNIPGHRSPKTITRDLKPSGSQIPVTNANRLVYISDMARHRLQSQPYAQTSAFLRGLSSIIEPSWLSMFNQSELQTLIGGARQRIDLADLRANTIYGGLYVIGDDNLEHPSVRMFWSVMDSFSDEDRGKVLKFVTSTPRAPLLGFGSLNPRFSIRDGGNDESRLPSTSTCVNLLKLPVYRNQETLRTKLLQAVNAGAGFDLS